MLLVLAVLSMLALVSCSAGGGARPTGYRVDADSLGVIEKVNNIYNASIVSNDPT